MARERNGASAEAGMTMRNWGWFAYHYRDATICQRCGATVFPGAGTGTWDFPKVGIPIWDKREALFIDVEVKAGNTALRWDALRPEQRFWAADNPDRPKWLWICLGNRIGSGKYPRRTVLMPYEVFLEMERKSERQSLPYAHPALEQWDLIWVGRGVWDAPLQHPLRTEYHYL